MSAAPRRTGPVRALAGMLGVAVVAGLMLTVGVVPAIALTGMGAKGGIGMFEDLPQDLKIAKLQQKTQIFAKRGDKDVLLASFFNQNRDIIGWKDVPATVKNAALAAEDVRFYEHGGVDPMGIVRAVAVNALHKGSQGASTISQQYVKNVCVQEAELLPTDAKVRAAYAECTGGVERKLREARLAIGLEKTYSKDEILLGYLNIAGFGGRIYGIESAAQYYFDTHAKDLTPAQAASLMAMVNNPNVLRIDIPKNLEANRVRRDYILKNELNHGLLDRAAYEKAVATAVKPRITPVKTGCAGAPSGAGFFCDYVSKIIRTDPVFGKTPAERDLRLQSAGWKVYTTLDLGLQKAARATMKATVPARSPAGTDIAGAAVTVQVGTGRILSMVQSKRFDDTQGKGTGGKGYTATSVNYSTDYDRGGSGGFQPGSTYKTFTLIDWLQHGHGLNEMVNGDARSLPAGALKACGAPAAAYPDLRNDTRGEGGYQTVMQATKLSVNGAFASMAEKLDLCDIRKTAESLGVHRADRRELDVNPSSILGTNQIAPLTMATAYAGVANRGTFCGSVAIDRILTSDGKKVSTPSAGCKRTVDESVAVAAGYALHGVLTGGTARSDASATGSAWGFGKTGTTDDAKDTWLVGGTTKTVTAAWVGNVGFQAPRQSLRLQYGFPYCQGTSKASNARHCLWSGIQAANQAKYPGDTSWPEPAAQYLYGQKIAVPEVAGKSVDEAKEILGRAGFQAKVGGSTSSDDVEKGKVVSTDPGAGSQVSAGSVVTIVQSDGPQQDQPQGPLPGLPQLPGFTGGADLPSVVGMREADAVNALHAAGFQNVVVGHNQTPGSPLCLVNGQLPAAGRADQALPVGINVPLDPAQPCQ